MLSQISEVPQFVADLLTFQKLSSYQESFGKLATYTKSDKITGVLSLQIRGWAEQQSIFARTGYPVPLFQIPILPGEKKRKICNSLNWF